MKGLSLAVLALCAAGAHAQLIVGNDQSGTASIYHVDVVSGVSTAIYSSANTDSKPWGMAYDNTTNTLYWNNAGTLFSSPFSMGGLTPTNLGALTFNGVGVNYVALGFRNGRLYGTRNIATEAVYEINPMTLDATQVYVHPSTFDLGGLDVDATNGKLYGLNDSATAPGGRGLFEIDVAGQSTTLKAPYPGTETDIDGLAVHNGLAYYVTDGPNTAQASFYVYNVNTGLQVGTLASPFTGTGTFSAATFISDAVPEPATMAALGLGVAAFIRRRRRL